MLGRIRILRTSAKLHAVTVGDSFECSTKGVPGPAFQATLKERNLHI